MDLPASYDVPVEVVDLTVGAAEYLFPNQTWSPRTTTAQRPRRTPSTREAFVTVGKEDLPAFTERERLLRLRARSNAFYGLVSVSQGYEVTKELSLDATLSLGAATATTTNTYFGVDDDALNDGNAKVGASYAFNESISLNAYAMYTYLLDSSIRDAAKENDAYFNKGDILSGGVSLGYSF